MTIVVQPDVAAPARPGLWRLTRRSELEALRRQGRRGRGRELRVTWLPAPADAPPTPARAAFAVGRSAGSAVVRNRVRRRLRAALRELASRQALPAGDYLVGAGRGAAELPWPELVDDLATAVRVATEADR